MISLRLINSVKYWNISAFHMLNMQLKRYANYGPLLRACRVQQGHFNGLETGTWEFALGFEHFRQQKKNKLP